MSCVRQGAAEVMLKPAAPGTGVVAGGAMRAILEAAGVKDVLAKSLGSSNKVNNAWATMTALKPLKRASDVARLRGKNVNDLVSEVGRAGDAGRRTGRRCRMASPVSWQNRLLKSKSVPVGCR